jgi:hypothetical protein
MESAVNMNRWYAAVLGVMAVGGCACGQGAITADAGQIAADAGIPYAVELVDVQFGEGAGYGQEALPGVVLGAPSGGGEFKGGLDVLSLGKGGSITLRLGTEAVDGSGPDIIVFENAFRIISGGSTYAEPAELSVSEDGLAFLAFPCNSNERPYLGCAGVSPVYAGSDDGSVSATDPTQSGGDAFDLADVGLPRARFVRLTDRGTADPIPNQTGFDLDAVAVVLTRSTP